MKVEWKKLGLIAAFAGGLAVFYATAPLSQGVNAAPTGAPVPSTTAPALNTPFTVTASWNDDQVAGNAILTATKTGATGSIGACSLTANSDGQTATIVNGTPSDTCTVSNDLDSIVEVTTLSATYTCTTAGTVTFVLTEGGANSTSAVVNCGGAVASQITVTFSSSQTCGAVNVQAFVAGANGLPVPDGTVVTFLSTQGVGVLTPAQATTVGGYAFSVFTPTTAFTAITIQATALGITGQNVLQLTCAAGPFINPIITQNLPQQTVTQPVTQPASQPAAQPQPISVAPAPILSITPPRTGDGGLAR
ncbi:MAG TPA: hypothetical protein VJB57_07020 [Dehalococcoidia bacterium]|nr:hypothetical protein [Dehalococcoidia bacterium]